MKTLIASILFSLFAFDEALYAQGTLMFNNLGDDDGEVLVFSDRWSGSGVPLDQDLNFQLNVAPAGGKLTPVRSWLLSDGTAMGINVSPGRFADPSHSVIVLPGIAPGSAINVEVNAWTGNYDSLADAMSAGVGYGIGRGFTMGAGSAAAPPAGLELMPELEVRGVPEPGVPLLLGIALGLIGLARRRRSWRLSSSIKAGEPNVPVPRRTTE